MSKVLQFRAATSTQITNHISNEIEECQMEFVWIFSVKKIKKMKGKWWKKAHGLITTGF